MKGNSHNSFYGSTPTCLHIRRKKHATFVLKYKFFIINDLENKECAIDVEL